MCLGVQPVKTILVVDDEQELADVAVYVLTRAGYEVHQAHESYSALKILTEHPVDLLLTDVTMPGMSGLELAEVIRALDPLAEIPILGVSSMPQDSLGFRIEVFDAFLQKPFYFVDLLEKVSDLVVFRELSKHPQYGLVASTPSSSANEFPSAPVPVTRTSESL